MKKRDVYSSDDIANKYGYNLSVMYKCVVCGEEIHKSSDSSGSAIFCPNKCGVLTAKLSTVSYSH